jgi:GNAT superfamily N-acetyltransferase
MPDMLVRLYDIPPLHPAIDRCQNGGIRIHRARAPERPRTAQWANDHFPYWVSEIEACFANAPISCHLAVRDREIVGFACHDAFAPNFFGPTGVAEQWREKGIGTALLLSALHAQRAQGYAYAIIGGVGPAEYYEKTVGARVIEGSDPGAYDNLLV